MSAYIAFLDLLGTKETCKDSGAYLNHISNFFDAVHDTSCNLEGYGKVGIFSDSAYAESTDLKRLLDFLVQLRIRLISKMIFFNAVVKKGQLNSRPIKESNHLFGVTFSGNDIADLYISHTKFKGIGIYIDKSIENEIPDTGYFLNDCIFVECIYDVSDKLNKYYPICYKDISFRDTLPYKKIEDKLLETVMKMMYSSYLESPKQGRYYIPMLINILKSNDSELTWNKAEHTFSQMSTSFSAVYSMLKKYYSKLSDLPGVEYLAFVLLDIAYCSKNLDADDQIAITKLFADLDCIKSKYIHSLNSIPEVLFSKNKGQTFSNRELFIQYCKNDMSRDFVVDIMNQ